jgi:hypothetical protein
VRPCLAVSFVSICHDFDAFLLVVAFVDVGKNGCGCRTTMPLHGRKRVKSHQGPANIAVVSAFRFWSSASNPSLAAYQLQIGGTSQP